MKKYSIVCVLADYSTNIIGTYLLYKDATEARDKIINKDFKTEETHIDYKVYHELNNMISIYYNGYFGKTLLSKYFIIEYDDLTDNYEKLILNL